MAAARRTSAFQRPMCNVRMEFYAVLEVISIIYQPAFIGVSLVSARYSRRMEVATAAATTAAVEIMAIRS